MVSMAESTLKPQGLKLLLEHFFNIQVKKFQKHETLKKMNIVFVPDFGLNSDISLQARSVLVGNLIAL